MSAYVQPTPTIPGWMHPDELAWLYAQAQRMDSIVEVGAWLGRSTHALLSGCHGTVWAVDHWLGNPGERATIHHAAVERDLYPDFWANVGHFPHLRVLRMPSVEAAGTFPDGSVEMVFVDGDHDYPAPLDDLRAWWPKCRTLLCGHDRRQNGVPRALREFGHPITEGPGTLWSIYATPA